MRSTALMLFSIFAALLFSELVLRLMGQSYYWAVAKAPDASLGWRPAAGVSGWQRFEGEALVETNQLGFRDHDHAIRKAADTIRIAVLGDSFTEAVQVPVEQTWWRVMERTLNAGGCPGLDARPSTVLPRFEVLNFAVSGYSTAQSLLAWRNEASAFSPDLVMLEFFLGNDLVENARPLDDEPLRPYLIAEGAGLALDDGYLSSPEYRARTSPFGRGLHWLMVHSRILQTAVQVRHGFEIRKRSLPQGERASRKLSNPFRGEPGVDGRVFREPVEEAWQLAWSATERMLALFADEVRAAGAEPLLLIAGTGAQVHPDPRVPAAFAGRLGLPDLGYPVRRLLREASDAGLPTVNLPAIMAAEAERRQVSLHGFDNGIPGLGHWNADGHRLVGAVVADALCRQSFFTRPSSPDELHWR